MHLKHSIDSMFSKDKLVSNFSFITNSLSTYSYFRLVYFYCTDCRRCLKVKNAYSYISDMIKISNDFSNRFMNFCGYLCYVELYFYDSKSKLKIKELAVIAYSIVNFLSLSKNKSLWARNSSILCFELILKNLLDPNHTKDINYKHWETICLFLTLSMNLMRSLKI